MLSRFIALLIILLPAGIIAKAQSGECVFKDTSFFISFGTVQKPQTFNLNALKRYQQAYSICPEDGFYSYTTETSHCFNDDWITMTEDHTANDVGGKMMLVNASERASDFFLVNLDGFKPGTNYEFTVWLINVCKPNSGCLPLPPDILISLQTPSGKKLGEFRTGKLPQNRDPLWKKYYGLFTVPAGETTVTLRMMNTTNGSCGNDFAMDDILIRECYPPPPPTPVVPEKVTEKSTPVVTKPSTPKPEPESKIIKKDTRQVKNGPKQDSIKTPDPILIKPGSPNVNVPLPLISRKNTLVKQIETPDADILIELYDNGEIDGDTVSIYHNNELVVSHRGLSEKPIQLKIRVDDSQPTHEIVMVADNLGSIPPNTSLMVVTAKNKRYEVFISSSEKNNAKVIIQKEK